ncbi:hypothetical protein [Nitrosomonas communis]|uniref:Uncharacterized protein n=1 Tax=Nitrosomonas communis TaxID=44574 RepID=A0A1I4KF16_9PROT|nr:hypothetical protein [Nitrosomonas communis]SFL77385.1 hypothetical protein SAMN05421863_100431 [Nitrosomonas communis]
MIKKYYSAHSGIFLLLWVLILTLISQLAFAVTLFIDNKGYIYGRLSNVNLEKTYSSAYAGDILLGHDSTTFTSIGNQPANLVSNPWEFCFEKDRYEEIENLIGNYVVLEFKTPKSNELLSCSATKELVAIYPVDENQVLDKMHFIGDINTSDQEISRGVEFGRIVNVFENKNSNRTYFMTVQMGSSGNSFRHFLIDDHDLYDFAVIIMKAAAMVKIHYSERLSMSNPFGQSGLGSMSYVSEIEIVGGKSSVPQTEIAGEQSDS